MESEDLFDVWNNLKKKLHAKSKPAFCNTREVWWCSIGMNIGTELYGKNELFERPILVLQVFNKETIQVVPLTTKQKFDKYHSKIVFKNIESYATFTHIKTISTKRLSRKMGRISKSQFEKIISDYRNLL